MKRYVCLICALLVGCVTSPGFFGLAPTAYQSQDELPPDSVMLPTAQQFTATVSRYWVYAPASLQISSTEYDLEHYGVELLKDGRAAIGTPARIVGEYHSFFIAEVEGLGYLFAPKFDIRDQIQQRQAQSEYEANYQALQSLFRSKQSVSPTSGYLDVRKALAEHEPSVGDKLKIEVVPHELQTGGASLSEANRFSFSGFPTDMPEGPDNPHPFHFYGADLFVAKAFAGYSSTNYPFSLEFTVYGTVVDSVSLRDTLDLGG